MDLKLLFDQQIIMEEKIATLYRRLAVKFGSFGEASFLWDHMADLEEQRAGALYWCRSLVVDVGAGVRSCLVCGSAESRRIGIETVNQALNLLNSGEMTVDQALLFTSRIENLEVKKLGDNLLSLPENDIFRDVIQQLVGHKGKESDAEPMDALIRLLPKAS